MTPSGAQDDAITLKPMDEGSFNSFRERSLEYYAKDRAIGDGCSIESAMDTATKQFNQIATQGLETLGQFFYDIVVTSTKKNVGHLWLGILATDSATVRINDIFINEQNRSKGYGRLVLRMCEDEAKKLGANKLWLHVFAHNSRALNLYKALGFKATSIYMSKEIGKPPVS